MKQSFIQEAVGDPHQEVPLSYICCTNEEDKEGLRGQEMWASVLTAPDA